MAIIGHTSGGAPIHHGPSPRQTPRKSRNPLFACTSATCTQRTTKNQAKKTQGLCLYCKAPLKGFQAFKPSVPDTLTPAQLADACLSYRHDFGLLEGEERARVLAQAADWWRCFARALNDPSVHIHGPQ